MANTFELISSVTVGAGGAASIDFTSIPSTYTDLCVVLSTRGTRATYENGSVGIRFNNDSGSNYNTRSLMGRGTSPYSETTGTTTFCYFNTSTTTATASTFGNTAVYIPNYTASTAKSLSIDSVGENNGTNSILDLGAGYWSGTAAINRITFIVGVWDSMTDLVQYSTAYLYGVKNA